MTVQSALIVDDDETSRAQAHAILMSLGIADISIAENGKQAAETLNGSPHPDLILCDIIMPERDGIELVGDLVKVAFAGGLILMSSKGAQFMDLTKLIASRKKLNLWATLNKPLDATEVASAIANGLAKG